MKSVLFVAVAMMVGCATDLHEMTACGSGAPIIMGVVHNCELACSGQYKVTPQGSDTCTATNPSDTKSEQCNYVATIDGVKGCCGEVGGGSDTALRFYECQ